MSKKAKNPVKTVETTFEILDTLQELDGAGVTELAEEIELPKSTVHNYLSTLEQEEYVFKEDGKYLVGIRFLELGAYARDRLDIYDIAKPEIDKLAEDTGELANLLIEEHGRGAYLHRAYGEQAVSVEAHVGTRIYLHSTALGKSILAFLSKDRVTEVIERQGLPPVTEKTITKEEDLFDELSKIRERGYAYDDEERIQGLRCVAAPILSNSDRVLGAISVAGPTNRMRGDRFREEIPRRILEGVNVIELNVTYS